MGESEARLRFYAQLPKTIKVKEAATKDLEAIKIISQKVWDKFQNFEDYSKHMKMFLEGDTYCLKKKTREDNRLLSGL